MVFDDEKAEIEDDLQKLWKNFNQCRAYFPHVPPGSVGKQAFETAPYYANQGLSIAFRFNPQLTDEMRSEINSVGHWLNQNFVIRLFAVLQSHGYISNDEKKKIPQDVEGWECVDLVRRLRNYFSHGSGRFSATACKRKTVEVMIKRGLVHSDFCLEKTQDFPLAIDTVLEPLYLGCKAFTAAAQSKCSHL